MRRAGGVGVLLAGAIVAGCQTERVVTSDGRPMPPKPRPAPRAPVGAEPNRLLLIPQVPEDSDANGYPDLIRVTAALFAHPHLTSVEADGDFVLTLYRRGDAGAADATPIRTWRLDADAQAAARSRAYYGACYAFSLSLREGGTDRLPATSADLRGRYDPAQGGPEVHCSDEPRLVQIGRGRGADGTVGGASRSP